MNVNNEWMWIINEWESWKINKVINEKNLNSDVNGINALYKVSMENTKHYCIGQGTSV